MKITPKKLYKAVRYLKRNGMTEFMIHVREKLEPEEVPYGPWFDRHKVTSQELQTQRANSQLWEHRPLVSVCVPLYDTPEIFLIQMIESVMAQSYTNWQLCLADGSATDSLRQVVECIAKSDERIKYQHLEENLGIAGNTNAALTMAEGEWIGLLDHDDLLAADALYEVMKKVGEDNAIEAVYTDEDKVDEQVTMHCEPHMKPDYNEDLLRSNNYITHFFCVKRSIVEQVGGFDKAYDGAQDYDFIFRCTEEAKRTAHVAKVLYHWRMSSNSTADNPESKLYAFEAGARAIKAHLARLGIQGEVSQTKDLGFYRVKYPVQRQELVSILIPNKDEAESLRTCIEAIKKSEYTNYEIIVIENNSEQESTFDYYKELADDPRIQVVTYTGGFNYSAINNYGATFAKGSYLVLMNNDVEVTNPGWLTEMLGVCERPEVGIVGVKLLYPDDTIQHAGIVMGIGGNDGVAGNMFVGKRNGRAYYLHRDEIMMNYSAVTAALLMIRRELFDEAGQFTEELAVAFNDTDLCLKVGATNHLVVYDPYVQAYHYESKSRGLEDTKEKMDRFEGEKEYVRAHWGTFLRGGDPCYNPNLSLVKSDYSLRP